MEAPLKIAICEDSADDAAALRACIHQSGYPAHIECFISGDEFLMSFEKGRYHLILLDIFMSGLSGVETAAAIRERDARVVVIFTTSSVDFTLESYRLNALKYLEKPVQPKDVKDALELAWSLREKREVCTVFVKQNRMEVPLDDICYVEVVDHTCIIHMEDKTVETDMRIVDFASLLPSYRFLRCHRGYIVNLDYVAGIDRDFTMKNGEKVYVRGKDLKKMSDEFKRHLIKKTREA